MKYRSTLIVGSTLTIMLALLFISLAANGALTRQWTDYSPIESSEADGYSLSDGTLRLNINTANASALDLLSGIGETLAERIIEYREEYGSFESIEDLKNVKGIGDKKLDAIRESICCE